LKLTSASSSARRTSLRVSATLISVICPCPLRTWRALSSFSLKLSNIITCFFFTHQNEIRNLTVARRVTPPLQERISKNSKQNCQSPDSAGCKFKHLNRSPPRLKL